MRGAMSDYFPPLLLKNPRTQTHKAAESSLVPAQHEMTPAPGTVQLTAESQSPIKQKHLTKTELILPKLSVKRGLLSALWAQGRIKIPNCHVKTARQLFLIIYPF